MRTVTRRSRPLVVLSLLGAMAAGPAAGIALARWSAPGSGLTAFVSPIAFGAALVAGMWAWFGVGLAAAVAAAAWRLLRRRPWRRPPRPGADVVPPGFRAFLPLSLGCALLAGTIAGLASPRRPFLLVFGAYALAGAAYGGVLVSLARGGLLPFPEPQ